MAIILRLPATHRAGSGGRRDVDTVPEHRTAAEGSVKRLADFLSNAKTIVAIGAALLLAMFFAGISFRDASERVTSAVAQIERHDKLINDRAFAERQEFEAALARIEAIEAAASTSFVTKPELDILARRDDVVQVSDRIAAIEQLSAASVFRQELSAWKGEQTSGSMSGVTGGIDNPPSICPAGTFMVGVDSSANSVDFCVPCLTSVTVLCRPLIAPNG